MKIFSILLLIFLLSGCIKIKQVSSVELLQISKKSGYSFSEKITVKDYESAMLVKGTKAYWTPLKEIDKETMEQIKKSIKDSGNE
jgi:hypothetical protein